MGQVENMDYYVCKLPDCGAVIQFVTYEARSKILNLYTSHFQRKQDYIQPTACPRDWLHTVQEGAEGRHRVQGLDPHRGDTLQDQSDPSDEGHHIRVKIRLKKLCGQVIIVIISLFKSP